MSLLDVVAIVAAGFAAGAINAVVGSGTMITFPTLLALGYPPVVANVSNTVGLVPGSLMGAWGYREELRGQRDRVLRFGLAALVGGAGGAVLLLALPPGAFEAIVPVLIVLACVLVAAQPWISRRLKERPPGREHGGPVVWLLILLTAVYGGYFGAAQGVLLLAVLGLSLSDSLQRLNAVKNVQAGLVNLVAGLVFVVVADVDWAAAGLIALGSAAGGLVGARVGRRLSQAVLRGVVVAVGLVAVVLLVVR
ncbi:sulfite exporter TauE/SafE family protein [Jiangella rhizosphaerae]|uniref:Probable membrane transporter protein n=1 Tax=Jiangella rhizosphaerae TaxID=2293569 RepID=A0A418KKG2_9ACTN|nr:sulfite exporter TauE/SafE family protein [Jiangella rhizosphaerae]RIQ15940.1 sulfite exporter TauE/SafE family protein [Jiangella rhizosphaerae]